MQDVISKLEETIDIIDNNDIVKRLKELKVMIDEDLTVQKLMNDFNAVKKENNNMKKLVTAKTAFYNHPLVSEYRSLYSTLNKKVLKFNKDLASLIDVKNPTCGRI